MNNRNEYKDTFIEPSLYLQQTGTAGQTYKLIIQVDKIRARPGPKSKKQELMAVTKNNYKHLNQYNKIQRENLIENIKKDEAVILDAGAQSSINIPSRNSLTSQDSSLAKKNIQCSTRQDSCNSAPSLCIQQKKHFVCELCDTPYDTKFLHDYHKIMHMNSNLMLPYMCHLCKKKFDDKRNLKVHVKIFHSETKLIVEKISASKMSDSYILENSEINRTEYQCEICRIILQSEDAYRHHVALHSKPIDIINSDIIGHEMNSQSIHKEKPKYSCKVCCKEFDTSNEVEAHTHTHVEIIEAERKCNICKKSFKTEKMLNDHLAHHLSRAHHCATCRKAFINRTTLKIHMKTHRTIK